MFEPKPDGYRSHHMVFKFRGTGPEEVYDGRRVEIQIRTALQHSWATAVEAVGLFRREDMKAGKGDADWRLFALMSSEFAMEEHCAEADTDGHRERIREIVELDLNLDAVDTLERLSQAFEYTDKYQFDPRNEPDYFKIIYNRETAKVRVEPLFGARDATQSYDSSEVSNAESGYRDVKIVLVEVDEIENLKTAYPIAL